MRYLITSAIPYINGVKHVGNLVGSMLPADVYARFLRQEGEDVLYICGTDEHGTPAELAAQEAGLPVSKYCDEMYTVQKRVCEGFSLSFDYFGRSSSPTNTILTQEIYQHLKKNGYIEERALELYYSADDQRFLPDRYVEGTCPHCGYARARGDQCDGCAKLLDPKDLINPYSSVSKSRNLELRTTRHLFLNLSKLQGQIAAWVETKDQWPDTVKGIAKKWLQEGLQPRCITRDLSWGVPVPELGYENKVFYVWFDAPNAYISITQDWAREQGHPDAWRTWWMDEETHYTQFMAKDNVAFHAIFWPGVLFAANMGIHQVDFIKGVNWLTYEGGKFSTSQKRGIFMDTALELFPSDVWRYYLMAHLPESADADFDLGRFADVVNKDLADVLGNFCHRVFALLGKHCDGRVPLVLQHYDEKLLESARGHVQDVVRAYRELKFLNAAQATRALWTLGNAYLSEREPWTRMKTDREEALETLVHALHLMRLFAIVGAPLIPTTAQKILDMLRDETVLERTSFVDGLNFSVFSEGHVLKGGAVLFDKIAEERIEELRARFAGGRAQ